MNRLELTGGVRTAVTSPERKSKRFALSLLFAVFGLIGGWAQTNVTFTYVKGQDDTNGMNQTKEDISINLEGITKIESDNTIAFGSNDKITIKSDNIIKKIVINNRGLKSPLTIESSGTDITITGNNEKSEIVTWEGSANNIVFTSNGSERISSIVVSYISGPVFDMTAPTLDNVALSTSKIILFSTKKTISYKDGATSVNATFGKKDEESTEKTIGTIDTNNDGSTITFNIPNSYKPLAKNTTYELTLPAGEVKDNNIDNSTQTFTFTTVEGVNFTMTTPEDKSTDIPVTTNKIVLTANKENIIANTDVDIKDKIKVTYTAKSSNGTTTTQTLTVNGKTTIEDNTLVFTPTRNLRASMTYTISLDAGVVTDGSEPNEAFTGTFTTASNEHMITGKTSTGEEEVDGGYSVDMGSICMIYGGDKDRVANAVWDLMEKDYNDLDGRELIPNLPTGAAYQKARKCQKLDPVNEYCNYNAEKNSVYYGDYITTNKWKWSTRDGEFDHTNHLLIPEEMTHQKTFHQPCYGNLMFRPRVDGTLTVYLLQQGAMHRDEGKLVTSHIRKRPVYIIDETGTLVQGVKATTLSNIPTEYNNIKAGATEDNTEGTLKGDDMYSWEQAKTLKDMYDQWIKDNNITAGKANDSQGVICLHHKSENVNGTDTYTDGEGTEWKYTKEFKDLLYKVNGSDRDGSGSTDSEENEKYNDNTGFMLIDEGYVKYEFPVLAGKTYNIFGYRTKIGYIGFDFDEDPTYDSKIQTLTLDEINTDNSEKIKAAKRDKPYDVTINRSFTGGRWATLVLPFSVGQLQVKEVFGEGTEIIHFDSKKGNTINLKRHIMQMIVGGTPVLIKPGKDVKDPVFTNVHFTGNDNTADIDVMSNTDGGNKYEFKATYDAGATVPEGSYFISGNDGAIYQTSSKRTDIQGFRAWIEGGTAGEVLSKYANFLDFGDIPDNETTGIIKALADPTLKPVTGNIYDINGRLVRQNASSVEGLPKGIYIMNGKKLIVK